MAIQRQLSAEVIDSGDPDAVHFVAGTDISTGSRFDPRRIGRGAVVVVSWPDLICVEQVTVEQPITFPYVPGLLSFRECPVLLEAFDRLNLQPDLIIVDGQGLAHPRRFGIACHLGVLLNVPTIGCAKSRLTGRADEVGIERGATAELFDADERIGRVVRTKRATKPLYVSPGHRIGIDEAARWVLQTTTTYRLPEPTRLAHLAAAGRRVTAA